MFFRLPYAITSNFVHNCEDYPSLDSNTAVHIWFISYTLLSNSFFLGNFFNFLTEFDQMAAKCITNKSWYLPRKLHSPLSGFQGSLASGSNWNLEMLVFEGRGEPEYPEKNLSEQSREPTTNLTQSSRVRESNPGHIGGRPVLSPLRQPC